MRKCHCTSNTKIKGVFRGFFQEGNLEHGCDPVGLIELEDGTISAPCATSIQFDEPPKEVANDSASHNSVRNVSCATCSKNIDDDHCESGGWNGSGSCTMWAPRNQHP